jgi:hypothetical protein
MFKSARVAQESLLKYWYERQGRCASKPGNLRVGFVVVVLLSYIRVLAPFEAEDKPVWPK